MKVDKSELRQVVVEAVREAFKGRPHQVPYKDTERRLHAYNILKERVEDNKYRIEHFIVPEKSADIVRFKKTGVRVSEEDIFAAWKQDLEAKIAADEFEISEIDKALELVGEDHYFLTVEGKYILGMTDEDIALSIDCAIPTVRKHRGRLVNKMTVWLYGAEAVR
ncbi:MAG: hypothetical protein FWG40_00775 [Peptococcaceae bacterium]|nr:hypothetical protein [Peptococcaceae bacterium]